ncbi:hypothetical protein BDK51DRAFT_42499 [Blyttiomyces helicus]|uniref:Uncharacterized protein n=1 Tax=Blyttiomyces helicus TaxID=388810 RepID=A0A4P9WKU3_9FUNG|nr:hypothetical protein BDK51DRAFT_42499 [Blyttiomyces helicus]|eukprot:RKO92653.1 hypothetical protein BDK51DRAFT_42499 [Blyttiomyces helicus]
MSSQNPQQGTTPASLKTTQNAQKKKTTIHQDSPTPFADPETLAKVRKIVRTQFDLELLLKRQEIASIRDEIARGEDLLQKLHHFIINGAVVVDPASLLSSPASVTRVTASGRPVRTPYAASARVGAG